jgi:NADPH2:quinone reductase
VRPIVGARLKITEAAEAHRLLTSSKVTGKVVLILD